MSRLLSTHYGTGSRVALGFLLPDTTGAQFSRSHLLYIPPTKVGGLREDGIRKTLYFICCLKAAVFNVFLDKK